MSKISVTIIISHYEQHAVLDHCVISALNQSEQVDSIIIVDDNSHQTPTFRQASNRGEIKIIRTGYNSGGPATPRNIGVENCETSHLIFADADDILLTNTVESMKKIWSIHSDAIAHGDHIVWGMRHQPYLQTAIGELLSPEEMHLRLLREGNKLLLTGTGGATNIFKNEKFDTEQRWEDYELWLRLSKKGVEFRHTGEIHSLYKLASGSRSGSRKARREGCKGIETVYFRHLPWWDRPAWFWKQRWI